jgi:hypothetical protein
VKGQPRAGRGEEAGQTSVWNASGNNFTNIKKKPQQHFKNGVT